MKNLILFTLFLSGICQANDTELLQKHLSWESRVVSDNTQVRFRSNTYFIENGEIIVFTVDRLPTDCTLQYLGMNVMVDSKSEKSFFTDSYFGQLRIDEYPVHDITYSLQFIAGSNTFFLNVTNFNKELDLITELERGQNARFKLKTNEKEYYVRFNLSGFKDASQRTLNLCNAFNQNNDQRYFDKEPKTNKRNKNRKDDASYF